MEYEKILINLIGEEKYNIFLSIKEYIEENYNMEQIFKEQKVKTKKWKYELKFVKSSKTFSAFYFTNNCLGYMIILGREERNKIQNVRNEFSKELLKIYDETETYHDGKWLMMELNNMFLFKDIKKLLAIKRKPSKK